MEYVNGVDENGNQRQDLMLVAMTTKRSDMWRGKMGSLENNHKSIPMIEEKKKLDRPGRFHDTYM
jgi:hypothetical protein